MSIFDPSNKHIPMPNFTNATALLDTFRRANYNVLQTNDLLRDHHLFYKKWLSECLELPLSVLSSLNWADFMSPLSDSADSAFHLPGSFPTAEDELYMRVLRQIIREGAYTILTEPDSFSNHALKTDLLNALRSLFRQNALLNSTLPNDLWNTGNDDYSFNVDFLYALSKQMEKNPNELYNDLLNKPYGESVHLSSVARAYHITERERQQYNLAKLGSEYQLGGFRNIKGDGNCYYRSVVVGCFEQLALCHENERRARFRYISNNLSNILSSFVGEDRVKAEQILEIMSSAADGRALNSLSQIEAFLSEHDRILILIARKEMAAQLNANREQLLEFEVTEPGAFEAEINQILTMNEYAEGRSVQLCFLNQFFGVNIHVCDWTRNLTTQNASSCHDVNGFAPLPIFLDFRPGHYNLFQTQFVYENLKKARLNDLVSSERERRKKQAAPLKSETHSGVDLPTHKMDPVVAQPVQASFVLSVLASPAFSNGLAVVFCLAAMALLGAMSLGILPAVAAGIAGGVCLCASFGLFGLSHVRKVKQEEAAASQQPSAPV